MHERPRVTLPLGLAAMALLLIRLLPGPRHSVDLVSTLSDGLLRTLSIVLWLLVCWMTLTALGGCLVAVLNRTARPSGIGLRLARRIESGLRHLTPRVLRVVLVVGTGAGVATGCSTGPVPPAAAPVVALDWPVIAAPAHPDQPGPAIPIPGHLHPAIDILPLDGSVALPVAVEVPGAAAEPEPAGHTSPSQTPAPATIEPAESTVPENLVPDVSQPEPPAEHPGHDAGTPELPTDSTIPGTSDPAVSTAPHTVVPGDTLWAIAAGDLGPGADDAAVDAHWRAWYRANADLIGDDPDYLRPGWVLQPPG